VTTISEPARAGLLAVLGLVLAACGEPSPTPEVAAERASAHDGSVIAELLAADGLQQWKLPKSLREISGLALTADERLLAIADERAEIHELDYRVGERVKRFGVGDPVLAGDFEGIAVAAGEVWIITSTGTLVAFEEGEEGERVAYRQFDTGLDGVCEIEGLASEPRRAGLLIACKEVLERSGRGQVWLFRWHIAEARLDPAGPLVLDEAQLAAAVNEKHFNPSGVSLAADGATLWILAARQRAVARIALDGEHGAVLLEARRLPARDRHRQPEGIEVLKRGVVLIADEGGNGSGRLGLYGDL
jgi:uncharacterized protein YjiK